MMVLCHRFICQVMILIQISHDRYPLVTSDVNNNVTEFLYTLIIYNINNEMISKLYALDYGGGKDG